MSETPSPMPDTAPLIAALDHLSDRLDAGIESLRGEARETRRSLVLLILVALLILGGALGVSVRWGDARVTPPPPCPPCLAGTS